MIIRILAAIFTAVYLIEVVGWHMIIKRVFKITGRVKPFDCGQCLAAWIGLILYFAPDPVAILLLCFFGSGYLAKYFI